MKDLDPSLLVALGLSGLGLVGLGFSAGRSNLAKELDERLKKEAKYTSTMIHRLRKETYKLDSTLRGKIEELDQRTASRIWKLEKLAGLEPTDVEWERLVGGDHDAD